MDKKKLKARIARYEELLGYELDNAEASESRAQSEWVDRYTDRAARAAAILAALKMLTPTPPARKDVT